MGLKENTGGNLKYVRLKDGKFYLSDNLEKPYPALEGLLTSITYRDEKYNGEDQRKCQFSLFDAEDGTTYVVSLNTDSSYYSKVLSFLMNADLSKPITFHPKMEASKNEKGEDIQKRSILVSQYDTVADKDVYMKGYFTKDDKHGLPEFKQIKVGKKISWDKTDALEYYETLVEKVLRPKLPQKPLITHEKPAHTAQAEVAETVADEPIANAGKLPWD